MEYRFDKSSFKKQTFREADQNQPYWKDKTAEERLAAAWFLICQAYDISYDNPPPMDRTYFTSRKRAV